MSSSGGSDDEGARETEASSTQASQRSGMFLRSQAGIGTNGSGSPDNESGTDQSEGNPSQGGSSTMDNTFFTAAAGSGSPAQKVEERIRELELRMPFRPKNISTNGQQGGISSSKYTQRGMTEYCADYKMDVKPQGTSRILWMHKDEQEQQQQLKQFSDPFKFDSLQI